MPDFIEHSNHLLKKIDRKFTIYLLINGSVVQGVFNSPQTESVFKSQSKGGNQLSRPINNPELKLNKKSGQFNKGDPVHFLCGIDYPDCTLDKFTFNETDAYCVTLIQDKSTQTDVMQQAKKWQ